MELPEKLRIQDDLGDTSMVSSITIRLFDGRAIAIVKENLPDLAAEIVHRYNCHKELVKELIWARTYIMLAVSDEQKQKNEVLESTNQVLNRAEKADNLIGEVEEK